LELLGVLGASELDWELDGKLDQELD